MQKEGATAFVISDADGLHATSARFGVTFHLPPAVALDTPSELTFLKPPDHHGAMLSALALAKHPTPTLFLAHDFQALELPAYRVAVDAQRVYGEFHNNST